MRNSITTAAVLCIASSMAFAQPSTAPTSPNNETPSATRSGAQNQGSSQAGQTGQNQSGSQNQSTQSGTQNQGPMTEAQVKSKIESDGFSNVTELKKDANGKWTGKAMKSGKSTQVSVDSDGRVAEVH